MLCVRLPCGVSGVVVLCQCVLRGDAEAKGLCAEPLYAAPDTGFANSPRFCLLFTAVLAVHLLKLSICTRVAL